MKQSPHMTRATYAYVLLPYHFSRHRILRTHTPSLVKPDHAYVCKQNKQKRNLLAMGCYEDSILYSLVMQFPTTLYVSCLYLPRKPERVESSQLNFPSSFFISACLLGMLDILHSRQCTADELPRKLCQDIYTSEREYLL